MILSLLSYSMGSATLPPSKDGSAAFCVLMHQCLTGLYHLELSQGCSLSWDAHLRPTDTASDLVQCCCDVMCRSRRPSMCTRMCGRLTPWR